MNYKKLLPNLKLRLKILDMLEFIPDKLMIKLQYWIKTGRKLNLKDPKRYNKKLQWYKLYYRDSLMTKCSDKYRVRELVSSTGLKDILKTNNGSCSHANILCSNKNMLNINETVNILNYWLKTGSIKAGREWAYYNIKPKIICEKFLKTNSEYGLIDYKFYCFNGEPS